MQSSTVFLVCVLPPGGVHRPIDFYNVSSVIDVEQEESRSQAISMLHHTETEAQ